MKSIYLLLTILVLGINDEIFSQSNATILIDSTICVHIDSLKKIKLKGLLLKLSTVNMMKERFQNGWLCLQKDFLSVSLSVPVFPILQRSALFHSVREGIGECRVTHRLMHLYN